MLSLAALLSPLAPLQCLCVTLRRVERQALVWVERDEDGAHIGVDLVLLEALAQIVDDQRLAERRKKRRDTAATAGEGKEKSA